VRTNPLRKGTSPGDVLGIMNDLIERANICHERLVARKEPGAIVSALVSNVVQMLAALNEALCALEELCPYVKAIRTEFDHDLSMWIGFRHDAAHVVDRMLRPSPPGIHEATRIEGQSGNAYMVLGYEAISGEVRGGDNFSIRLSLRDAISRARSLFEVTSAAVHANDYVVAPGSDPES